jgi:tRNA A-37 threonylcarbamoyl transferase component Bud32
MRTSARRPLAFAGAFACALAIAASGSARDLEEGAPTPFARWFEATERETWRLAREFPSFLSTGLEDLQGGALTSDATHLLATFGGVMVLLLFLARVSRGRGTVSVAIEYPPGLRGTFRIDLSTRQRRRPPSAKYGQPSGEERALHEAGSATAMTRWGVMRETQFVDVACRRHWVSVDGFLQTSESEDIVAWHFDDQEVTPGRDVTKRVRFDFAPRACPVEVRVAWDRRSVDESQIARYGVPGSLRLARGPVQYSLDRGLHRLVAGKNDRVAEVTIEVESFEPRVVVVDLAEHEQILFLGCPRAVEPYLNGDVPSAARALERDGQSQVANRLLARFHEEHGRQEPAARHYELAGDFAAAAEICQALQQFERAARLFEQIGDDERAGEMFRSAGEMLSAGEAYARADSHVSAVECFRNAGDVTRWIEALSKSGQHLAAAEVALERGDRSQAIQCLNCVTVSDPGYPRAIVYLAEAYQQDGHQQLAARKLEEMMATRPEDQVPSEAIDLLASIYELNCDWERALQMLERLRMRDATWPHIATRLEAVRKARSTQTTNPDTSPPTMVSEAFSGAFRYEIVEEVGRGGMGVVFRARDRRLGREVALKRLPDNIRNHPKAIELFLREARAAAALNHPNIVTLFDAGQEGDTFYITMELLCGAPLQKILREKGRLPAGAVAKIGGQVARGLQYAHEQGIVHRDIKTANLFFSDKKVVKIMDFGLAKMVEEVRRSTTVIGGTPYYMAPEQSAGEQVDHRADLYALGVTFYELLTGRVPFKDGDVAFHHRHTPAPNVRDIAPGTPADFAALVAGLLEKRPAARIRSAGEVVKRLAEIARAS